VVVLVVIGAGEDDTAIAVMCLAQKWKELYHEFGDQDLGIALQMSTEGTSAMKVLVVVSTARG
jgi:hypothetical protein